MREKMKFAALSALALFGSAMAEPCVKVETNRGGASACPGGARPECSSAAACGSCRPKGVRIALPDVDEIRLEGTYPGHLQDVWYDGEGHLYWAATLYVVKSDLSGRIIAKSPRSVEHLAGLEVRNGRVYVAACIIQSKTGGKTTPECRVMVREYDAESLEQGPTHTVDLNDRSGSLAILDDGTFVVGCLRPMDIAPTQVRFHHLGKDFKPMRPHVLDNVPVRLGIEVIRKEGDFLYLCEYGKGANGRQLDFDCVKLDREFREVGRGKLGGGMGLVFDGDYVWIGKSGHKAGTRERTCRLQRIRRPAWTK